MCNHIGNYLEFFFKNIGYDPSVGLWPNKYMTKEMVWENVLRLKHSEIVNFNILKWIFILGVKSVKVS